MGREYLCRRYRLARGGADSTGRHTGAGRSGPGADRSRERRGGCARDLIYSRRRRYIADAGAGTIFRVDSAGTASVLLDKLAGPSGLALDGAGHLFFSEQDGARVRRLDLVSGDISDLGAGAWNIPRGIALSTSGEIFVADTGRQQIMRGDSAGQVTAIAGLAGAAASAAIPGFSGDGAAATAAQLNFP